MSVAHPSESVPDRVLITGISGFTGQHLARLLVGRGCEVHGTTLDATASGPRTHRVDLLDRQSLNELVDRVRPNHVVHLAAISFVAHGDVDQIYRTNIVGTRNLLHALAERGSADMRCVLLASSANIYGNTTASPITEDTPPQPANDYAVSKLAMEHMAALWSSRLPITLVRPFNYTGVGQAAHFVVPKIVAAFRNRVSQLELGNIDVERDLSDVRDVVEAYRRLLEAGPRGVFNVCSGRTVNLREVLAQAERITGHSLSVTVNPSFVRANEVKRLCGSSERLLSAVGHWKPRPFQETLEWMLLADAG